MVSSWWCVTTQQCRDSNKTCPCHRGGNISGRHVEDHRGTSGSRGAGDQLNNHQEGGVAWLTCGRRQRDNTMNVVFFSFLKQKKGKELLYPLHHFYFPSFRPKGLLQGLACLFTKMGLTFVSPIFVNKQASPSRRPFGRKLGK